MLVGEFVAVSVGPLFGCGVRAGGDLVCWSDAPVPDTPLPGPFVDVAAGREQVCAVHVRGEITCWGDQVTEDWRAPRGPFASVSVGGTDFFGPSACGVRTDGGAVCWGPGPSLWQPEGVFESVSVGGWYSCGLRSDGEVRCWDIAGDPLEIPGGRFVSIAAANWYACGVRVGGNLECWGQQEPAECLGLLFCWGWEAYPGFAPAGPFAAVATAVDPFGEFPTQICAVRVAGDVVCWNGWGEETGVPPAGEFVALDSSSGLWCGLRPGGTVTCWGLLDWEEGSARPVWRPAQGTFATLSVGTGHACGLRSGGEVACWGADRYGETRAPSGEFASVSAGRYFSCGLRADGEAECWGTNQWWEAAPPPGPFGAVYAGSEYACGIRLNRSVECWGRDSEDSGRDLPGEFAVLDLASSCGLRPGGELACWGSDAPAPDALPGGSFSSISGDCGLRPSGDVVCWAGMTDRTLPSGSLAISTSGRTVCAIRADRTVECSSEDWLAEVAQTEQREPDGDAVAVASRSWNHTGPRADRVRWLTPEGIADGMQWVQEPLPAGPFASLGAAGQCGIRPTGHIDCWGGVEARLGGAGPLESVTRRFDYWCGLGPERHLDCAGATNSNHEHGSTGTWSDDYPAPLGEFVDVAVGIDRACAIRATTGEIVCWGPWADIENQRPPGGAFAAITIGVRPQRSGGRYADYFEHTCAIAAGGGELACWGDDHRGQTRVPPARLAAGPYPDIVAGGEHTCALRDSGEIICWGDNRFGQAEAPAGVYTALTAGRWHTCALTVDSDAVCWGDGIADAYIDPPDGTPNIAAPTGPFTAISAGDHHTCALRADGELACWLSY